MSIPQDLRDFLSSATNRKMILPDGEVRELAFFAPEDITSQKFIVNSYELYLNGRLERDPEEQREYEGYSLICECNDYSPDGLLAWFPDLQAYGAADPDHQSIIIYPGISWADILREPTWFINGQWYPDRVAHQEVNPWHK